MKASAYKKYGAADVVKIMALPKPTPKDNEVLVKVYSSFDDVIN